MVYAGGSASQSNVTTAGARGDDVPPEERVANDGAQDFCVPTKEFESFVARKGVHPGIVAGRLRRKLDNWKIFTKHLAKVRAQVISGAVVDGWGEVAPTETP
jgi:HTH-type transcriptional regulator / antitoxin HigA